ncbi:GNAT family N-acetyltransferase [Congregibacter variabilis]|uniref:GNAT family N-acetyltransferase n=1 Tax=Congregibacter variabilis TaxID=3081200 RepID=A0ABZ0I6R3_9GAMM|nr:GNAT family N-acetyltransferase [Congregibacter sp. IMCC43200]
MNRVMFRSYLKTDKQICLDLFDANCPEYFAPNERADYLEFLAADPNNYELCEVAGSVVGAFGLFDIDTRANEKALNWILLDPQAQGRGIGSTIMARVTASAMAAGTTVVHIATSHKAKAFFEKFGAQIQSITDDGWGPGMHRVDMSISL